MNWNEVFQIISGVIISIGGAGFIFWKLSSYFGELWVRKHLESIRKEYRKEIEAYKFQLDMLRETILRYSGRQFELYNKLWRSLYDLKSMADALWDDANEQNLRNFSRQLKKTIDEIERSYLFIEENHYRELKELLKQFGEYKLGKIKLVQLYKRRTEERLNEREIRLWINHNRERKQRYEQIIDKIGRDLKNQIRGGI